MLNEFDQIQFVSYKKSAFATVAADSPSRFVSFYMTMTSSVFSPWSYFYIPAAGIWLFALNSSRTEMKTIPPVKTLYAKQFLHVCFRCFSYVCLNRFIVLRKGLSCVLTLLQKRESRDSQWLICLTRNGSYHNPHPPLMNIDCEIAIVLKAATILISQH